MAEALVPPHGSCILKCKKCKGLYIPEKIKIDYNTARYDPCPFCGYRHNSEKNTIPVWIYNLLKFFRSGKHVDDIEAGLTKFELTKEAKKKKEELIKKKEPEAFQTQWHVSNKNGYYYYIMTVSDNSSRRKL